ncbi:MAG: GIY-YIG nuclease family protein [bacterium]|nr:GIY-YIG nuclease family protein [bacterium]
MNYCYVYVMSNRSKTLYLGVTNDLKRRVFEHKSGLWPGFTKKYNLKFLIYFEMHHDITRAIAREKQLKGWLRKRKLALIVQANPQWADLTGLLLKV